MICENCGAQVEDEVLTVYCKKCGHKLTERDESGQQKKEVSRRKWFFAVGVGAMLLVGAMVFLVVMRGSARVPKEIYGEWSDEHGILSLTFQKDGSVRVGAGSGFLGAELFTFTKGDGNTLYLKANADGALGKVSLQIKYELQGNTLVVSVFGVDYLLERK